MTIQLKPDQERVIGQAIQAGLTKTADDVIDMGMETLRRRLEGQGASVPPVSPQQWVHEFHAWVRSHPPTTPLLSDEAVSRESIYRTRGQCPIP